VAEVEHVVRVLLPLDRDQPVAIQAVASADGVLCLSVAEVVERRPLRNGSHRS
jgi:hypothetical protein